MLNKELEQRIVLRTREINKANNELSILNEELGSYAGELESEMERRIEAEQQLRLIMDAIPAKMAYIRF